MVVRQALILLLQIYENMIDFITVVSFVLQIKVSFIDDTNNMLLNYTNPSIVKFCSHFFCASFTNEWQLFFKVVELQYQNISCVVRLHVICFTKFHSMTSWYLCFIHIRYDFCCNSILIFSWIPWTKGLLIIVVWNIF